MALVPKACPAVQFLGLGSKSHMEAKMCIGAQGAIDVGPGKFFSIWGRDIYLHNGCLVASLHYVVDAK